MGRSRVGATWLATSMVSFVVAFCSRFGAFSHVRISNTQCLHLHDACGGVEGVAKGDRRPDRRASMALWRGVAAVHLLVAIVAVAGAWTTEGACMHAPDGAGRSCRGNPAVQPDPATWRVCPLEWLHECRTWQQLVGVQRDDCNAMSYLPHGVHIAQRQQRRHSAVRHMCLHSHCRSHHQCCIYPRTVVATTSVASMPHSCAREPR